MRSLREPAPGAPAALPACRIGDPERRRSETASKPPGNDFLSLSSLARFLPCLFTAWLAFVLSGCAGYKLGPSNNLAAGEKSVQITPFANQTLEPRLGDAVTGALRKELQRDGTYRLASRDAGDIVVNGIITRYLRQEQTLVPEDVITVRDYRIVLTAQVTARDRATGKVLLDQPVTGYTLLRVGSDLTSAERQALPLLAADFARQVTALLADGSW